MDNRPTAGEVTREQLLTVLTGRDPRSRHQLLEARGSAVRAQQLGRQGPDVESRGDPDEWLSLSQAGSLLGLSPRYLRRRAHSGALPE